MVDKKRKWLLYVAMAGLATSMVSGVSALNADFISANAEVVAQDIAELDICNGTKGNAGSENAFYFYEPQAVPTEVHRIHEPGAGYWSHNKNVYDMDVSFQMEFGDWGDEGWVGFRLSNQNEIRIYNHQIETVRLVGTDYEGAAKTAAFSEEITSGWHTVRVYFSDGNDGCKAADTNFSVKVTIDGVETSYDHYTADWGMDAIFSLVNTTGTTVYMVSAKAGKPDVEPEGEMSFTDVPALDIAEMEFSDGAIGNTGSESAFNFNEIDEISSETNRLHYTGYNYWQWDIQTMEINVNFHLEFTEWNGGWFGFKTAALTELRIYNDRIEIYADGRVCAKESFAEEIKIGWHAVNMTYQLRSSVETGEVNGSRLTVTIDNVAYEAKTNYYPMSSGHAFMLMNMTGDPVNALSAKKTLPDTTYTKVKKQEISDVYIANGGNVFNFNEVEKVAINAYNLFTSNAYDTIDTVSLGKDITFKAQFSYWGDGWLGFNISNASVRIYNDKIAIFSCNENGEYVIEETSMKLDPAVYSGWHIVRMVYQNKYIRNEAVGSRLLVVVDGVTYTLECDFVNVAGQACQMVNETGTMIELTAQNTTVLKDLSDWWIIDGASRANGYEYRAGEENAFNFLFEEEVAKGEHIFHDKPDYWSYATTYSTGGFEFVMTFGDWNVAGTLDADGNTIEEDGYFAIRIGSTIVRIYLDRAELFSSTDSGETYTKYDTVSFGIKYSGAHDITVLIDRSGEGTKVTLTIGESEYVLEGEVGPTATHSYLINSTGTKVLIQSQFKNKMVAFIQSYLDYENYYEREIDEASILIAKTIEKLHSSTTRVNVDNFVAALCRKLDLLPIKAEVDAMIIENATYKNIVATEIETQLDALEEDDFTNAQWLHLQRAKENALFYLTSARNAEETDCIANDLFAEVQLVIEDATKLAFYISDITEKLQNVEADSEVATILENALVVIQSADFATQCEDVYLAAVQALEGNGQNESNPDNGLNDGGSFEKIENSEDNISSDNNGNSILGCSASLGINYISIVMLFVLTIYVFRRKEYND